MIGFFADILSLLATDQNIRKFLEHSKGTYKLYVDDISRIWHHAI